MKTFEKLQGELNELDLRNLSFQEVMRHPGLIAIYSRFARAFVEDAATMNDDRLNLLMGAIRENQEMISRGRSVSQCPEGFWAIEGIMHLAIVGMAHVLEARQALNN